MVFGVVVRSMGMAKGFAAGFKAMAGVRSSSTPGWWRTAVVMPWTG